MKLSTIIFLFFFTVSNSQTLDANGFNSLTNFGLSTQFYPAGIILTVNADHFITNKSSLIFRLGGNLINRKDFSKENDNEKGAGFGGSFGYRKHFFLKKRKIIVGINNDIWNLWIDWKDNVGSVNESFGKTYILVLQPWLEAGYHFNLKNATSQIGVTAGFGREINVLTIGEKVGQGWIASISIHYYFTNQSI